MTIDMTHERQIELAVRDAREDGRKEGREDGIKEGREESRKETILNMLEDNLPIEKIVLYTGCTVSNIEDIRKGKLWSSIYEINRSPIDWCIANNVLKEFLEDRKPEVLKAMTIDMTHERQIELAVRDAREEGIKQANAQNISNLMKNAYKSFNEACSLLGINDAEKYKGMI